MMPSRRSAREGEIEYAVRIAAGAVGLPGDVVIPPGARGVVLFAHGSGSSRLSPRNQYVAQTLRNAGVATLLFDLLTPQEETEEAEDARFRFDIGLLTRRLVAATDFARAEPGIRDLSLGYFGASTGAAAALTAAVERSDVVQAIVSRGGRPDLAGAALGGVKAPTLLIVGGRDTVVLGLNQQAYDHLRVARRLAIVPGATHLFEEPGALQEVGRLAADWFTIYLK